MLIETTLWITHHIHLGETYYLKKEDHAGRMRLYTVRIYNTWVEHSTDKRFIRVEFKRGNIWHCLHYFLFNHRGIEVELSHPLAKPKVIVIKI